MEYLALPFTLRDDYLARSANLQDSISYSIGLLLSTRVGVMDFFPEYGCDIWRMEYADVYTANKADIRASLRNAIDRFEKRLYNVSVSFANLTDASPHVLGITVKVTGNYRENDEEKKFEGNYCLG
jgi:phage baseplate assembly protein W